MSFLAESQHTWHIKASELMNNVSVSVLIPNACIALPSPLKEVVTNIAARGEL